MLILGQNGDVMVNVERIHTITTYQLGNYERGKEMEKRFRILAWYGSGEDDCWGIGDYATEDRAKKIIREVCYGEKGLLREYILQALPGQRCMRYDRKDWLQW